MCLKMPTLQVTLGQHYPSVVTHTISNNSQERCSLLNLIYLVELMLLKESVRDCFISHFPLIITVTDNGTNMVKGMISRTRGRRSCAAHALNRGTKGPAEKWSNTQLPKVLRAIKCKLTLLKRWNKDEPGKSMTAHYKRGPHLPVFQGCQGKERGKNSVRLTKHSLTHKPQNTREREKKPLQKESAIQKRKLINWNVQKTSEWHPTRTSSFTVGWSELHSKRHIWWH